MEQNNLAKTHKLSLDNRKPVSYTHLDVYKRQNLLIPMKPTFKKEKFMFRWSRLF